MRTSWILFIVFLLAPSVALACPVCGTGPERSREAYVNMTLLLSLLPLGMVGGLVYLFVRHSRQKATPPVKAGSSIPAREPART